MGHEGLWGAGGPNLLLLSLCSNGRLRICDVICWWELRAKWGYESFCAAWSPPGFPHLWPHKKTASWVDSFILHWLPFFSTFVGLSLLLSSWPFLTSQRDAYGQTPLSHQDINFVWLGSHLYLLNCGTQHRTWNEGDRENVCLMHA